MQRPPQLTLKRIKKFLTEDEFGGKIYPLRAPVGLTVYSAPDCITYAEAMKGTYRPTQVGEKFGPLWSTHWFRIEIDIPETWAGKPVYFLWNSYSETYM